MMRTAEEILMDIDATLDHLIENATVIKHVATSTLFISEVEALQKTQESLLARLVHMNDLLKSDQSEPIETYSDIEEKILRFGRLNAQMMTRISSKIRKAKKARQPRVRPHRRKVKA